MNIKRMIEEDNRIGNFINGEFLSYAEQNNVDLNYNEFCFIAESDDGEIVGVITGRAYYNEVHIGDMIKLHSRHLDFKHRNSIRNLDISLNSFEKIKILNYASIFCQSESFDKFQFIEIKERLKIAPFLHLHRIPRLPVNLQP